jgi:hypothetical protein
VPLGYSLHLDRVSRTLVGGETKESSSCSQRDLFRLNLTNVGPFAIVKFSSGMPRPFRRTRSAFTFICQTLKVGTIYTLTEATTTELSCTRSKPRDLLNEPADSLAITHETLPLRNKSSSTTLSTALSRKSLAQVCLWFRSVRLSLPPFY